MKILKIIGSILYGLFALAILLVFFLHRNDPDPATCNQIVCENCLTEKQLTGVFTRVSTKGLVGHKYYKCVDCQTDADCKEGFACLENKCEIK